MDAGAKWGCASGGPTNDRIRARNRVPSASNCRVYVGTEFPNMSGAKRFAYGHAQSLTPSSLLIIDLGR
jgi:hypothetical protein